MNAAKAAAAALFQAAGGEPLLRAAGNRWMLAPGGGGARLRRRASPPFLILIYHRVHPDPGPFMIDPVPPALFERQMRHLARAYRPLPLATLLERSRAGTVPEGAVAVTFDDGYADNAEYAAPILARHGVPATIFLVTGCIGTGTIPWHDEVLLAFAAARGGAIRIPGQPADEPPLPLGTEAERHRAAFRALAALKPRPEAERLAGVRAIREALGPGDPGTAASLMLDWDRVRAMRDSGIVFGSHTETHPILSRVTSERAREEVVRSKRTIEKELGEEAAFFAYPNGRPEDYDEGAVEALRAAGYRGALTTTFGPNEAGEDPFRWRRAAAWSADPRRFALQLAWYRFRGADAAAEAPVAGPALAGAGGGR
ncbi:MAG TPA: polysaccharide deacetylase family protein [Candidatus Binatia bacterium]|nr:polysaccharide deacetylase family protein [Candidatus Binatia bacterium]